MNAIPAGVEAALLEAGFSVTEVAILRRLVVDDACTLREIAGRTGKSTGVLDQAMKKLLLKDIVKKESINNVTKYSMTSLDAVLRWMEEDDRRKRDLMARRHQSFEKFLLTVEQDKKRPEIEYFEGLSNFPKAYRKIFGCGPELLCFEPVCCALEEHPLRDFMMEWIRIRRRHGEPARVLAHNTIHGRRFQSRDPYEHRLTLLIDGQDYPFTFEKILCGDTVACFNYHEKRACLLRYPELASMERAMFEALWRQAAAAKDAAVSVPSRLPVPPASVPLLPDSRAVPLIVRLRSGVRQFLLRRKNTAAVFGVGTLVILIMMGLEWAVLF